MSLYKNLVYFITFLYGIYILSFEASFYNDDSLFLSRGIDTFSVIDFSPHFPGYVVIIILGKFINLFINDSRYSLFLLTSVNMYAYSYAAAGKEPTIDSKEAILGAINSDNFVLAKEILEKNKENYLYLTKEFNEKLFDSLQAAILEKDKQKTAKWLDISIATEIQRRLDGGLKNIDSFNIAKVMLAKADKFYKLLSVSLDKELDKKLKEALFQCTDSIGNPGLFGVGAKPVNKQRYIENKKIVDELLKSL